jgi:uncharacterized protein YprB with RNaseH-like and TPR domain
LRRRLEEMLGERTERVYEPLPLPFEREWSPWGTRLVRKRVLHPSEQLGKAPLEAAADADAGILALLALAPELGACDPRAALYLDTEATGLSGAGRLAFLVGVAYLDRDRGAYVVEQCFLRDPDDEHALLAWASEHVARSGLLVTYNGKSFDMPMLRQRCLLARVEPPPDRPHLDLLHLARRLHKKREWQKTLKSVERELLRWDRGPDVSGEEVAQRYLAYLRTGDARGLDAVITHNQSDVVSLIAILGIYGTLAAESTLPTPELAAAALTVRRAGDLGRAADLADVAVARMEASDGADALGVRAAIAKARGQRDAAVADLEAALALAPDPRLRLELAKLYEHHLRDPARALALVVLGTSERPDADTRRRERLTKKIAAAGQKEGGGLCSDLRLGSKENQPSCSRPSQGWSRVSGR